MIDDFNGDNERLIACIEALLDLDASKALVPHGIGGHARGLLSAAGVRLATKDREIAELRKELDAATAALKASALDACDRILLRADRDEARECGLRLWPLAAASVARLRYEASLPMSASLERNVAAELEEARAALAATPEHLRGQ